MFKVAPDQLRISEGWVRCGQCDEVFDAALHLLKMMPQEGMPAVLPEELAATFEAAESMDVTPRSVDVELDSGSQGSSEELTIEHKQVPPDAEDDSGQSAAQSIPDEFPRVDEVLSRSMDLPDAQTDAVPAARSTLAQPAQGRSTDSGEAQSGSIAGLGDISFLRDKRAGSFWYKPLMRATLVLLSLALLLGLAGQIVVHERERIAAAEPGLKPWLLAVCGVLNCTLSPLRRIESIVIDSSSFARIRGESYRLNFTLKNTAATALAMPAIELTLTDSRDQPVVRRVFLPGELGVKSDTLAAGSEWPASLAMAVETKGAADRVAGYRLLAFYP